MAVEAEPAAPALGRWPLAAGALALLAAVAVTVWWWQRQSARDAAPRYVTQAVQRGDLALRVSANGTLAPTRTVRIGSELSGTVARVLVDTNDRVRAGQLLLELDRSQLRDQATRSQAALDAALARLAQARAALAEARSRLQRQRGIERLSGGAYPAAAELDAAQAAFDRAVADEAAADAGVAEARAAVRIAATNVAKAAIRSPVDGVVLERNVDPGNAVAASLQAVTLFSIALDLRRMKLQVLVDEADVGRVREGQSASFTVSAYPDRRWPATIRRLGYGSTTKDNVVSYVAELEVDNPDLSLRPGMTAVATVVAAQRSGVLLVPSAALRFAPAAAAGAAPAGVLARLLPRPPGAGAPRREGAASGGKRRVWVLRDGAPVPVAVTPGLSDGRLTEVADGELAEGEAVIVGQSVRSP